MAKYLDDVKLLLEHVGGKDNIATVTHCVTRMRFVLKDTTKADEEKIKSIKMVKGVFSQAGQFQVIIGNEVSTFFNEFVRYAGIESASKEDVAQASKQNMTWIQRLLANLAEIFSPLIPALITGGLI